MLDPVTGAIIAGGSAVGNIGVGYYNLQQQKDNLQYQKWVQRRQWAREDTAVRRRALDMSAAGLSKTLAAGSAAQAGPTVQTHAPQADPKSFDAVRNYTDITQTLAQAALTRANAEYQEKLNQGKLPDPQQEKIDAEIGALKATAAAHYANMDLTRKKLETEDYELFMKRLGGYTATSGWLASTSGTIIAQIKTQVNDLAANVRMGKITYKQALQQLDQIDKRAKEEELKQGKIIPSIIPRNRG